MRRSEGARRGAQKAETETRGTPPENQSKPEVRNRATGSATASGSRLKNQRATANPNAAKQT